jgi:hypothetical protein
MTRIRHDANYAEKRRNEYPALADQLDAVWKLLDGLDAKAFKSVDPDAAAMLAKIRSIKAFYPKPVK